MAGGRSVNWPLPLRSTTRTRPWARAADDRVEKHARRVRADIVVPFFGERHRTIEPRESAACTTTRALWLRNPGAARSGEAPCRNGPPQARMEGGRPYLLGRL